MAWYNSSWRYRRPILVDKLTAGVAAVDVTAAIPAIDDEFWANVLSSGNDVRVCTADGITLATYDIAAGWSTTTRTGTIEVQAVTPPVADCMFVLWLYWGNAGASDARTAFAPASARTGYVTAYRPSGDVLRFARAGLGRTRPPASINVTTADEPAPWILVDEELQLLTDTYQGLLWGEEISWIQESGFRAQSDDGARYDETKLRMAGRGAIRAHIHDGVLTAGNDYTLRLLIGTSEGRILDSRTLVQCRRIDEGA